MKKTATSATHTECVQACVTPMRSWGRRREFFGLIRTVRVHRDYGLVRDTLSKDGEGCVLVVDGGGLLVADEDGIIVCPDGDLSLLE